MVSQALQLTNKDETTLTMTKAMKKPIHGCNKKTTLASLWQATSLEQSGGGTNARTLALTTKCKPTRGARPMPLLKCKVLKTKPTVMMLTP